MRPLLAGLIACAVASSCMTSPPASASPRIRTAAGIPATLRLVRGDSVSGELLALDTAAVTLLTPDGIAVVRHGAVAQARFAGYRALRGHKGGYFVHKAQWEQIVLEARYPYGIPAPALTAIMRDRKQARVDTLRVP